MADDGLRLEVTVTGSEAAAARLRAAQATLAGAIQEGLDAVTVMLAGAVKENLSGVPGFPQWRTGRLSRSILAQSAVQQGEARWVGAVGPAGEVGYGRVLELGGTVPAHDIYPRVKQALAWPASGFAKLTYAQALGRRATPKQAQRAALRAHRTQAGAFAFAMHVHQEARYQRPIPYLAPTFEERKGDVAVLMRSRIVTALRAARG